MKTPQEIARELNARYLLTAAVLSASDGEQAPGEAWVREIRQDP